MAYQIQIRSDSSTNWSNINPVLAQAELGWETDTLQMKVGDGVTAWGNLAYFGGGGGNGTNYSNANVASYLSSGLVGNIIPSGNAVYSLGNATNQWKDLWISNNTIYIATIPISLNSNSDLTVNGNPVVTANANANGATNVNALEVSGNLGAANANVTGNIIAGSYFIGDGGFLSNINVANIVGSYSNANVANYLPVYTGNINAAFYTGDAGLLSNVHVDWNNIAGANANVAAYLASGLIDTPIITSNTISGGNINTAGTVSAFGGISTSGNVQAAGNVAAGNLTTTGVMSASGNVTGGNIATAGEVSSAGNIVTNSYLNTTAGISTAGNVYVTDISATGNVSTTGDITGGNVVTSGNVTSNNITVASSITGNTISATGSMAANNLTVSENITSNTLTSNNAVINNNLQVGGNLLVIGNVTSANVSTLEVSNSLIFAGADNVTNIIDQGLVTPYGDGSNVWYGGWARNYTNGVWTAFANVTTKPGANIDWANASYADIQGNMVYGNVANTTGLAQVAYTGDYTDLANVPPIPSRTSDLVNDSGFITNLVSGNFSVTGTTTTGEASILGNVVATGSAAFAGPVTAGSVAAPGNISAGGNVTGLNVHSAGVVQAGGNITGLNLGVSGVVSAQGNVLGHNLITTGAVYANAGVYSTDSIAAGTTIAALGNITTNAYFIGDGSLLTNVTAAGSYANSNAAAFLANLGANSISTTGNVSASYFTGNGSLLTGLPEGYSNANLTAYLASGQANIIANTVSSNTAVLANLIVNGDGQISGNLNVGGNLNYTAVTNLSVSNALIYAGANNVTNSIDQGLVTPYNAGNGQQWGGWARNHATGAWSSFSTSTQPTNIIDWANAVYEPVVASAFYGDGGFLSNIVAANVVGSYGDSNVAAYLPTYTGSLAGGNLSVSGTAYLYNIGSTGTANLTTVGVGGNLYANAVLTDNYLYANGTPVSFGGGSSYSNANVANYMPVYGGNISAGTVVAHQALSTTGNVTADGNVFAAAASVAGNVAAAFFIGDGSLLTNLPGGSSYSNANVAAYLPTYAGAISVSDANASGNVSAAGNITGNYVFGNAAFMSGIPSSYSNANAAAFMAAMNVNSISTLSTVTAGHFIGEGSNISNILATNIVGAYGDSNVQTLLSSGTVSNAVINGNVTANYYFGNGSQLTGMFGASDVANFLPTYTGNISANNISVANTFQSNVVVGNTLSSTGDIAVAGNLNVTGNLSYSNVSSVDVANALIYLAANNVTNNLDIGFLGNYNNGVQQQGGLVRDHTTNTWRLVANVSGTANTVNFTNAVAAPLSAGAITATSFTGDGGYLSNIQAANVVGAYGNSNVAGFLPTYSGTVGAANVVATGNVTATFFIGDGSQLTNLPTGTVYSNANVANYLPVYTGNINANQITANYLYGDGSNITNLPFNYSNANVTAYLPLNTADVGARNVVATGNVTAAGNITATNTVSAASANVTGNVAAANVSLSGNITAHHFIGDGSLLSNVNKPVLVTSNISSLQAGVPLLVAADFANIVYTGGIFTLYQPVTGMAITATNYWSQSVNTYKNQYTDYANSVVNTSNVTMTLSAVGGTFNVQSSDQIVIGPTAITGANLLGLGIGGTGGTYNIPSTLFSSAVQTAASVTVTAALTTQNANGSSQQSTVGTVLTTIAPTPFAFTGISGSWPNANVVGSPVQSLNWSASGITGTVVAGNVTLSGSSNITLSANTSTSGTSTPITSNTGPYNITAVYSGTGLNGAGTTTITQVGAVVPATVIQPLYWKITTGLSDPMFTASDLHYDTAFSTSASPSQGAFTSSNTSETLWIAIPGTSWVLPDQWPPTNSPNLVPRFDQPPFNGIVCIPNVSFTNTINGVQYTAYAFDNFNQSVFIYLRGN